MNKLFLLLCCFCCIHLHTLAQNIVLHGVVLDTKTQEALPSASIMVEGGNIGAPTNAEGRFILKVPIWAKQQNLLVLLMGYQPYRIKISEISDTQNMRILLAESPEVLQEVAVMTPKQIVALA